MSQPQPPAQPIELPVQVGCFIGTRSSRGGALVDHVYQWSSTKTVTRPAHGSHDQPLACDHCQGGVILTVDSLPALQAHQRLIRRRFYQLAVGCATIAILAAGWWAVVGGSRAITTLIAISVIVGLAAAVCARFSNYPGWRLTDQPPSPKPKNYGSHTVQQVPRGTS